MKTNKTNKMTSKKVYNSITTATIDNATIRVWGLATQPRGSWRWQDAYAVSSYIPHLTRDGRWVWRLYSQGGKRSFPQIRRQHEDADEMLEIGACHNRSLTRAQVSALVFVREGLM